MLKSLKVVPLVIFIITQAGLCLSDTLFLKDGKVIEADRVWEQDNFFMYSKFGGSVGIPKDKVSKVQYSQKPEKNASSFQFDVWPFGTTVNEAINIAQSHDLPLHKHGIITVNKGFHPQVRKYMEADHFYYNTNLLGHFAKVDLFFTSTSKQLHTVQIRWPNQQIKNSQLISEIVSMISNKYGEYQNTSYGAKKWQIKDGNEITQKATINTVYLNYLHISLIQKAKLEIQQMERQRIQNGSRKDNEKF
ncbi:MAG: hypothetical protein KKE62_14290 [Proteobacteria bacterium]|nr:hypothetical protein [Pseudomonadota bacterium]MBU1543999.1 hypothetical protein [Pseudomonadota bacterium]